MGGVIKHQKIVALAGLIFLAASTANGSSIGVYFAPDATDCDTDVAIHTPVTWYILALLYGDSAIGGIAGAEFSQRGTPPGWIASWVPNPASNLSLIHPDGIDVGTNIAFSFCQTESPNVVLLYTVNGFAMSQVGPTCLWIGAHQYPTNPTFRCALVVLCDANFTKICVSAGTGTINATCYHTACSAGVEPAPWTKIKALYR